MKLVFNLNEGLNPREKQIYIDAINNDCEDIEDLKEVVHEIYWYDKGLFAQINKFPKDASFEDVKANMLKYLQGSTEENKNESLDESRELNYVVEPHKIDMDVYDIVFRKDHPHAGERAHSKRFTSYDDALNFIKRNAKYNNWDASPMNEDTIKTKDGKWTNKGKEGTHGKFDTKKEADEQRKAMFASGYHEDYERPGYEGMYLVCWDDILGDYHEAKVKANYPQDAIDKVRKRKNVDNIFDCREIDMFISPARIRKAEVVESLKESYYKLCWYDSDPETGIYGDKFDCYAVVKAFDAKDAQEKFKDLILRTGDEQDRDRIRYFKDFTTYLQDSDLYIDDATEEEYNDFQEYINSATFESLKEDTIKTKDGKWTNKGDEGTHGKFNTKKEADAQRKAMFANGYHESLKESAAMDAAKKLEDDGWTVLSNGIRGGDMKHYWLARRMNKERGKADWKAINDETGNVIDISYDQALGREPIGVSSGVSKLSKQLGKMLLPKDESLKEGDYDRPGFEDMYLVCWYDQLGDYHEGKVKASYPQEAIDKVRKRKNVYKTIDCEKIDLFISPSRIRKAEIVESLNESSAPLEQEIYDLLNDMGGYTDYQGRIDAVAEKFGISKDEAEGYVCNWIQFYNEEPDMDESLKEEVPYVRSENKPVEFDNDFINYNDFLADNFDGWSDDIDFLMKDLNKCARALRTNANKLVFYKDYDEDFYAVDDIANVVNYVAEDYSMYELSGTGIRFIVCNDFSSSFWIFRNEEEGNRVVNSVKSYVSSLNEDFKLEGLVDITDDFREARNNWSKIIPDVDFDLALERWNKESKLADPDWYAKPIYSVAAWEDMVQMFKPNDIEDVPEPEEKVAEPSDDDFQLEDDENSAP